MKPIFMQFQIGKSGLSEGVIQSLKKLFENHKRIRISMLPSSGRNRDNIKKMADELVSKLDGNYKYTIVGFTIIVKKHLAHPSGFVK